MCSRDFRLVASERCIPLSVWGQQWQSPKTASCYEIAPEVRYAITYRTTITGGKENRSLYRARLSRGSLMRRYWGSTVMLIYEWNLTTSRLQRELEGVICEILSVYRDYFMVGECVRFLFTSCEESQTNEWAQRTSEFAILHNKWIKIVQANQPWSYLFIL